MGEECGCKLEMRGRLEGVGIKEDWIWKPRDKEDRRRCRKVIISRTPSPFVSPKHCIVSLRMPPSCKAESAYRGFTFESERYNCFSASSEYPPMKPIAQVLPVDGSNNLSEGERSLGLKSKGQTLRLHPITLNNVSHALSEPKPPLPVKVRLKTIYSLPRGLKSRLVFKPTMKINVNHPPTNSYLAGYLPLADLDDEDRCVLDAQARVHIPCTLNI